MKKKELGFTLPELIFAAVFIACAGGGIFLFVCLCKLAYKLAFG